ncbi:MAG: hypothetical protein IJP52_01360 [Paludibacteraceae bacterium]|nr:hypothetical protein [Paludibacteraceae bacterium]
MRNIRSWSVCALMCVALFCSPARMHADGWTPTDGGLVVNLEQGDRFLLSVMVDHDNNPSTPDREYFVVNYSRYEGDDYFHYKKNDKFIYAEGKHLKLAQQDAHATEPSEMSIWSVGAPLTRVIGGKDYSLGANAGHVYTIWNDGKTLRMNNTSYQFFGDLTSDYNYKDAADVVFVIPTTHTGITSFDPNKTLKEIYKREDQDATTGLINGKIGKGFLGMTYREVYMLDIPKQNNPISYTNASLVCFNTTAKDTTYAKPNAGSGLKVGSGMPVYAFADPKHRATVRTLFRLYLLDKPFNYCSSYFFATDGQDFMNYRYTQSLPGDSTAKKKIYTIDWMSPMKRVGTSDTFKTDFMTVPTDDSTCYYVGYKNDFRTTGESLGSNTAKSAFKKIRTLPLTTLPSPFVVPAGAYGQMVVDTSSTDNNLGVKFEPAGYFLKVSSGKNVSMHDNGDGTWITEEMWTINEEWVGKTIKATLMTGASFSETDPGADVAGWSIDVSGSDVPVKDHSDWTPVGQSGYAQITTSSNEANGDMVFILADQTKWLRYDNNGLVGLEMPLQYPLEGKSSVTLMAPRIKPGYTFYGWCEKADGSSDTLKVGSTYTLTGTGADTLYALASYEGTLHIAISFKKDDGKRYFLTHPGTGTGFRYARARHFDSWVNTWQGMENAQNLNPNYLSTYEVRHPIAKIKKKDDGVISDISPKEHVLDPRSYTMKGQTDSLTFYENFHPTHDEYLGLYYQSPNTILANNTWAGLFTTTSTAPTSWPTYLVPYIESAKIKSERYVEEYDKENKPDSLILKRRINYTEPYVKYDTVNDQFNGQADSATATDFQLTAVSVSDEHYVLLPDTAYAWQDTITFDYHQARQTTEDIWSALVGKQLMAVMVVDRDTVYFHPNRKKHITDPNDLYLSPEFRITQLFKWIPDSRVTTVAEENRVAHSTTDHYWHHTVTSGMNSPMDVKDKSGNYIDIVDTFSITLSQGAISKIKKYYGRWEKQGEDDGLTVSADGLTRQRNIIVKTKTYHYGEEQTRMVLKPEKESYDFGPLANQSQKINFILTRVHVHDLLDAQGNFVREDIISIDTLTTQLGMQPGQCTFRVGTAFEKVEAETRDSHATVRVINDNTSGINYDTLVVTGYLYDNKPQTCDVRIPLMQAPLEGNDLLWSVMHNGQRYFIMAGKGTTQDSLIFRQYTQRGNTLYKRIGGNQLIMGAKDKTNRDEGYITPWQFTYVDKENHQFTLKIGLTSDTLLFNIASAATPAVGDSASTLTYVFTDVYANDNANYEEQVKLKYGPNNWLKFNGSALELTTNELEADTFSLAYPLLEFNLLNNGTYPSQNQAAFGYNATASASITTAYQGYCEYSTLLDNKLTYFARESRNTREALTSTDAAYRWKTTCKIDTLRDRRTTTESGLTFSNSSNSFTSTITPTGLSPRNVKDASGNHIDIVDTLCVTLGLQTDAPSYRFKGDWSGFKRIDDGNLKIPLVRKTYHEASFDSLICEEVTKAERHSFPAVLTEGVNDTVLLKFSTIRREGTRLLNTANEVISVISSTSSYVTRDIKYKNDSSTDSIKGMHLNNKDLAEVRLMDEYGNTPTWCKIKAKGDSTVTIQCLSDGVRSPRSTELYLVYVITIEENMRILTYHVTISQASHFDYANNQRLIHTSGASGDPIGAYGLQQVHQNKRILYYYPEQDVELPVRERNFYGWWRWYREGLDVKGDSVSDSDVPDSIWRLPPRNVGKYNYPYRIIGDSVMLKKKDGTDSVKVLVTMGRWTVFHYRSEDYGGSKKDPPAKNPRVAPPITELGLATKPTLTYAVDISNYYDNLPMSLSQKNQVDTALLDTILEIKEPTLSLREVFELHPWTEMADTLNHYKSLRTTNDEGEYELENEHYMEDHVVMAPTGNKLLLSTEQRYNVNNVHEGGSSESLLGYYMLDDNWWKWSANRVRQDTMIWCGGWDADCLWYTYNPRSKTYTRCNLSITKADDFLQVPVRNNVDTVYYCLRARSKKSTFSTDGDNATVTTVEGDSMFNICRYKVCYHYPYKYGPRMETILNNIPKALITNDEIEQKYDVLERLNFDYNEPGPGYTVYPHPLPWGDASYGYTYPETSDLPHNRLHKETDFPNHGEYGLINRFPYTSYWNKMEQHGGAEKGYMIYCDGMSSSGQVAALSLSTVLCSGQKMFLSAYVGNPSNQTGKANPNFIFSIQGKTDDMLDWEDITTYITGDIEPATRWYQILIPINHTRSHKEEYEHFRIRIYNLASNFDGNDFIIDDLCVFATKPPLIAYQANTACKEEDSEKDTHVIMRIDYQGIPSDDEYNNDTVYYTVRKIHGDTSFIALTDHYLGEQTYGGADKDTPSVYGKLYIPAKNYVPTSEDSVFVNLNDLLDRFDETYKAYKAHEEDPALPEVDIFREGYIYETLEGISRPVKYVIHNALMDPEDTITVHISGEVRELLNSICGMTSHLHVSNRMVLELNGLENPHTEVTGLCVNSTYDISLRVKGSLYLDSVAPIDLNGSCINDWLLYGDTADASSNERYGYYYSDIKKVITEILRTEPMSYRTNRNQFAPNLSSINKSDLRYYAAGKKFKQSGLDPYTLISDLVKKGFLTLYKSKITTTVTTGDSAKYVIFPIVGTGTDALNKANVEVCPLPIVVKLKPDESAAGVPLMIGGLHRDTTEISKPIEVLMSEKAANEGFKLIVDSIMPLVGIKNITLRSTNDPNFREGVHSLRLLPDISYPTSGTYYTKGDSIDFSPAPGSYHMQPGYSYTFNVVMQTFGGLDTLVGGCAVGTIPFILSVMPDYLRWDPQSAQSNEWNNADNWIGVTKENVPIHEDAHYAPMAETYVVIPQVEAGLPYPVVPPLPTVWKDSVQKVNFEYNNCNVIRFLPGAAMGQQQRMRYSDAVIDMEMPQQKWAFRAAPVTGMLSGDIYMSNVDLNWASNPWKVAEFDASGRSYKTGNGSFWLSVYSRNTIHQTEDETEARSAKADWSKVTNGLNLSLPAGQGYAVYARTKSGKDAVVRLPKHDDIYYYYGSYGETLYDHYVNELETARSTNAAPRTAGKLAFHEDSEGYTMSNDNSVSTTGFVFGNPTMGYIDIWGFIDDNCLVEEFGYLDESGAASIYRTVSREAAMASTDTIIEQKRYLPPMRSIMVQKSSAATSLPVTLNSNRVVTDPSQVVPSVRCGGGDDQSLAQTPQRGDAAVLRKGIMTVTAINPCSPRCTSYLLLGQGYHADILSGEDALLTTLNIDNFSTTGTPTTPFNIYAKEDSCGLSIDLRDEIVNVPISFYMSKMTYDNVTHLWFTGVNAIDGPLVLYDAQTDTERAIIDGICLDIATPKTNHETRYYIRRRGWTPDSGWGSGVTTDIRPVSAETNQTMKIIHEGHVLIIRNGQVFTMMGQQVR